MQRKDLALRVLSTAAIMSIVTSIAAPAFAGTYYMDNGNLSIWKKADGTVWVKSGSKEQEDKDGEVIICGGAGENQWSNAPSGGAAAATGTEDSAAGEGGSAAGNNAEGGSAPTATTGTEDSAAGEGTPPAAGNSEGGSTATASAGTEGSVAGEGASAAGNAEGGSTATASAGTEGAATGEGTPPATGSAEGGSAPTPTATASAGTEDSAAGEGTPTAGGAEGSSALTAPAAETEPSTALEDVTVANAYQPVAPTSLASSNWISVVNDWVGEAAKELKIRLSNVNIKKTTGDDTAPMTVDGSGSTTIELDGNNVLDASTPKWKSAAGLEKKGTGTLTITDTDSITAADDNTLRGSLTATGSLGAYGGAGIGSRGTNDFNVRHQTENITIAGNAYVKAYGEGNASGIGGGYNGNAKNIIIKDNAYVVAKGDGAGIGSGLGGGSSDVKIQGGTVVAEGKYTGIGGHYDDSDISGATETSTIEISGGTVYANGKNSNNDGVSIGSAGGNSNITISGDAKVKNTGRMGSCRKGTTRAEDINATITIQDNAMIADGNGAIGGDTNTNITIQDDAVIGDLCNGSMPGYIGTWGKDATNTKTTIWIKDNALIKNVFFIGGKNAAADIKIQDNAHIKKIDGDTMANIMPAIGSDNKRAEVTIGGSSDLTTPQQGTVRVDYAVRRAESGSRRKYTVIGNADGSGNVSIQGNVQLGLVSKGAGTNNVSYVKGDTVMTPEQLRDMIGKDSKIYLRNDRTDKLENIVHGKNVCAHVTGEKTGRKQDATCTEDGWVEYRCNYEKENGATGNSCDRIWTVTIPKKGHTWGEWTITPATCTSNGSKERECSVCHQKETETITALGHNFHGTENVTKAATCTTEGIKLVKCTRCDVWETQIIPATGHNYQDDWTVTTEPTCTTKGEKTRHCHNDPSHVERQEIPATGHQKTHIEGKKEPTCTEPGYTGDEVCDACGTVVKKGTVIPATGHHWKDNGDGTHTCPDCGATEGQPFNTNSALELRVVDAEGMDQPFTVSQNGTLRTYTGAYDTATLTGDLNTLRYLQEHGAQTIQFVTNGQTSSFAINDLLAQGSGSDVFYLTHRGAEEPTLLLVEADHSELVKD